MIDPVSLIRDPARGIVRQARPAQVDLTKFLCDKLAQTPSIAEAGTGVGKSFAYLLTAMKACEEGKRVVISTAMRSLQQQLVNKDLPYLASKVMPNLKYAVQYGKSNYGCRRQVDNHVFSSSELQVYDEFFDTVDDWVWDLAPEALKARLPRNRFAFSVAYCSKTRCDHYDSCVKRGYLAAKERAAGAQLLVVNHALIGAEIRVQAQHNVSLFGDKKVSAYVIDEAHKFPEAVRDALAYAMPDNFFDRARDTYKSAVAEIRSDGEFVMNEELTTRIPLALPGLDTLPGLYAAMHRETRLRGVEGFGDCATTFARTAREVLHQIDRATGAGSPMFGKYLSGSEADEVTSSIPFSPKLRGITSAMQVLYRLEDYAQDLQKYVNAIDLAKANRLHYVVDVTVSERTGKQVITVLPVDVSGALNTHYRDKNIVPTYLSATLSINGAFDHFSKEVGVGEMCDDDDGTEYWMPSPDTFRVGTTFDLAKQAWGYYPKHLPPPPTGARPPEAELAHYHMAIAKECDVLLRANEGHAFILCTSGVMMDAIADNLRKLGYPYPLLKQSEEMKSKGREIFMRTERPTLLGLKTYWEGIDIQGPHLTLVIIPKMPFPAETAIIRAKKRIAGDRNFGEVMLPHMLIDLRQMAGRLIRSEQDVGVLALLDTRVSTKGYGREAREAVGLPVYGSTQSAAVKLLEHYSRGRKMKGHYPLTPSREELRDATLRRSDEDEDLLPDL